jgi:hypothetical protein
VPVSIIAPPSVVVRVRFVSPADTLDAKNPDNSRP